MTSAVGVVFWLRTPNASNANNVRICNATNGGALNNNNANNSNGVAPIVGIVRFEYRKGKQYVSHKEWFSCLLHYYGRSEKIKDASDFRATNYKP